jgi:hypothetical protein
MLWRVLGESGTRGRFDVRAVQGLTPFVGRGEEIGLLRRRWDFAKDSEGQIALLSAPAGFGKSRIAAAFREGLRDSSITYLQFFGSPFHTSSPFYPFIGQLEWAAGIARIDSEAQKLDTLEAVLEAPTETKSDSAPLLSIPFAERYPPLQINEQVQKQRTTDVLLEQLVALSSRGPVLAVFEDAHLFDSPSLELMGVVIRRAADERWYEPELFRLKAEMLLALPKARPREAEQCLRTAIASAQQQEAKFWELRVATCLARLWRERRSELTRAICLRLFDTPDLKQAKSLLDELARAISGHTPLVWAS